MTFAESNAITLTNQFPTLDSAAVVKGTNSDVSSMDFTVSGYYNATSGGVNYTIYAVNGDAGTGTHTNRFKDSEISVKLTPQTGTNPTNNAASTAKAISALTSDTNGRILATGKINAGTYYVKASVAAVANKTNAASSSCVAHTIAQKAVTVTAGTSSRAWNNSALTNNTCTAGSNQLVSGHAVTCTMTSGSTITTAGSANITVTLSYYDSNHQAETRTIPITVVNLEADNISYTPPSGACTGNENCNDVQLMIDKISGMLD